MLSSELRELVGVDGGPSSRSSIGACLLLLFPEEVKLDGKKFSS